MPSDTHAELNFGAIFLEKKLITYQQLQKCVQRHKIKGGYLSQHLIELGFIKDSDVTTFLTCHYGFCYLPLKSYSISETALKAIPKQMIYDFCVMPIEKNDRLLTVTMADPTNKGVVEALRQASQCEIVVFISTLTEVREAIGKYFSQPFVAHDIDGFHNDISLRDNLSCNYVSNVLYAGQNRRRYKRIAVDLPAEYYLYPAVIKTQVRNVSISGVLFDAGAPLTQGTQMAMDIHLPADKLVTGIVEVTRCQTKEIIQAVYGRGNHDRYEVGAFFNFMSRQNQDIYADFLRQRLAA